MAAQEQRKTATNTVIRAAVAASQGGLDTEVFERLTTHLERNGGGAVHGVTITAKQVRNEASAAAVELTRACTDSAVLSEVFASEKRKSVTLAALENTQFPAQHACDLLDAHQYDNFTVWQLLLMRSGRYDHDIERFRLRPGTGHRETVEPETVQRETVVVGVRTSPSFRHMLKERLRAADNELLLTILGLIETHITANATDRRRERSTFDTPLGMMLCALIPDITDPFDVTVAQRLTSPAYTGTVRHVELGIGCDLVNGSLAFNAEALTYLEQAAGAELATPGPRCASRCVTVSDAAHAYCSDATLGKHRELLERADADALAQLMFSADPDIRRTAKRNWLALPSRPFTPRIEIAILRGRVTGWESLLLSTSALDHSYTKRTKAPLPGYLIDAAAPDRAALSDIVTGLLDHTHGPQPFSQGQISAILIRCAAEFTNAEITALVAAYTNEDRHAGELRALLSVVRPEDENLRCTALLRHRSILVDWLDGELWGEPSAEDASAVIAAACEFHGPANQRDEVIGRALLAGGLPRDPHAVFSLVEDPLVERELIRRYEDVHGIVSCAATLRELGPLKVRPWLDARPRSSADIAAFTRVWFATASLSWMPTSVALELISAAHASPAVLEAFAASDDDAVLELLLEHRQFPQELALDTLRRLSAPAISRWLNGELPGAPAVTEENLLHVLASASAADEARHHNRMFGPSAAGQVWLCAEAISAAGLGSVLRSYPGVPQEVYRKLPESMYRPSFTFPALSGILQDTLNLAGAELAVYALGLLETWEGSFDELDAVLSALRPDGPTLRDTGN